MQEFKKLTKILTFELLLWKDNSDFVVSYNNIWFVMLPNINSTVLQNYKSCTVPKALLKRIIHEIKFIRSYIHPLCSITINLITILYIYIIYICL